MCGGDIDPAKFNELVLQDTRVWAVEFYSPMCGSCTEVYMLLFGSPYSYYLY